MSVSSQIRVYCEAILERKNWPLILPDYSMIMATETLIRKCPDPLELVVRIEIQKMDNDLEFSVRSDEWGQQPSQKGKWSTLRALKWLIDQER